jgi:hypothetical protein
MKCSRCGRELSEEQVYAYQGKPYCDDCLMETGLHAGRCEPWASYLATKELGGKGAEALTSLQKQVYDFIKGKGKATRAEVCKSLKLSEAEIDAQLTPLMFAELVKERSEKGQTYLVAVR